MDALMRHNWPGNVRELIHTIEQSVALCTGDAVGLDDLPRSIRGDLEPPGPDMTEEIPSLREVHRRHILWVLEKAGGNRAQAARLLGTSERTFYRLVKRYGGASSKPGRGPEARLQKTDL